MSSVCVTSLPSWVTTEDPAREPSRYDYPGAGNTSISNSLNGILYFYLNVYLSKAEYLVLLITRAKRFNIVISNINHKEHLVVIIRTDC